MRYSDLPTEVVNRRTEGLDRLPLLDMLTRLLDEERATVDIVAGALPEIARVVSLAAEALAGTGRLIYVGAGTSGRLGVLDASECPPTFGIAPERVKALMAGGRSAVFQAREGAEDRRDEGERDLGALEPTSRDVVVGISASGTTPWVHGALDLARKVGAGTALVTAGDPVPDPATVVVRIPTGAEAIAGSTRLKAGTATKMVLNLISTGAMVRTGRVFGNRMVDLVVGSRKLEDRALRLVAEIGDTSPEEAVDLLSRAGGEAKTAIFMARTGLTPEEARMRLTDAGGFLGIALGETGK